MEIQNNLNMPERVAKDNPKLELIGIFYHKAKPWSKKRILICTDKTQK